MAVEEDEGSHTEFNPRVFHPSSVGYHPWLMLVNKLGLSDKSDLRGTFKTGELIHEYVQDALIEQDEVDVGAIEQEVQFTEDGLTFTGHADIVARSPISKTGQEVVVYDIKSRANWYHFDPPCDRHLDQLHTYMRGLDAQYGQVIYISKKDLEVRTWPEGAPFTFDESRWSDIKQRCRQVRDAIIDHGIPRDESEIPFDPPQEDHEQHYFYDSSKLDFTKVRGDAQETGVTMAMRRKPRVWTTDGFRN